MRPLNILLLTAFLFAMGCDKEETVTGSELNLLPPTGLSVVRFDTTAVRLTWQDNSTGEESFAVERKRGAGTFAPAIFVTVDVTEAVDSTGLFTDSTYTYRVRALRYLEASAYSNEISVTLSLPFP